MILNDDKIISSSASGILLDKSLVFDGSPSSPGISFLNEPSSGIYRISAGVLGIAIGGNKVAQIDINGIQSTPPYWNIVDQKADGVNGGTFSSGIWQTRVLNTTIGINTIVNSSLSSNRFTLPSGAYRIYARCPVTQVNYHKAKLRNITDSSDTLIGSSCYALTNGGVGNDSIIAGSFVIATQKTFEIQHQCTNTSNTNGFGAASNFGVPEIYTVVELWKVA